MQTYVIGDIQGCYDGLCRLLDHIGFLPEQDRLWCVGDLVNRGPQSLEVLRLIKSLPDKQIVLGNHDVHLIALAGGEWPRSGAHTLQAVLEAPDCDELVHWLCQQPVVHHDPELNTVMVHAGLWPSWSLETALACNDEVQAWLQRPEAPGELHRLYGDTPDAWDGDLQGDVRLRCIINICCRMRHLTPCGHMDFNETGPPDCAPAGLKPWFEKPSINIDQRIVFGHWSALQARALDAPFEALDGGYIWGGDLVALNLNTGQRIRLSA